MHNAATFHDIIDHPRIAEKASLAESTVADAMARKRGSDDTSNARAVARAARRETLTRMIALSAGNPRRADNHAELVDELSRINGGERAFQRELYEDRQRADREYQRTMAPAAIALDWLGEQHADWRAAGRPKGAWLRHAPAPMKGKISADRVRELREEIAVIEGQALEVSRRPVVASELKAAVDAALMEASKAGRLTLDPHQRHGDPFSLLDTLSRPHVNLPIRGSVSGASAVLVWLLEGELRQYLHEQIDAADLTGALSSDDQERELARLADRRLKLEREEEAAVTALADQGVIIARRPEVDPRAFLECEEAR